MAILVHDETLCIQIYINPFSCFCCHFLQFSTRGLPTLSECRLCLTDTTRITDKDRKKALSHSIGQESSWKSLEFGTENSTL